MSPIVSYKIYSKTSVTILMVAIFAFAWFGIFNKTDAITPEADFVANTLILTNRDREANKLPPLAVDKKLSDAAYQKAVDMIRNDYFSHISPNGDTPWNWMDQQGYAYIYAGENLAINYNTPDAVETAWMDSESHRENILNPNYDEIGIAEARGVINGQEAIVIVAMFGREVSF